MRSLVTQIYEYYLYKYVCFFLSSKLKMKLIEDAIVDP